MTRRSARSVARSARNTGTLYAALCAISAAVAACRGQSGDAEARAIARAFEGFTQASGWDRPAALDVLKSTSCKANPDDCADRDACIEYASQLLLANELAAKAREYGPVDAGGNGAATNDERVVIVSAAEDALHRAAAAEPKCEEALDRLRRRATGR